MNCVILFRINGGPVQAVMTPDGEQIFEFPHFDDAVEYAGNSPNQISLSSLIKSGQADYQIVSLDEL